LSVKQLRRHIFWGLLTCTAATIAARTVLRLCFAGLAQA
jgi:hypothetical protein